MRPSHVDELPKRFVMCGLDDRCVDFHAVTFGEDGGLQRLDDGQVFRAPRRSIAGLSPHVLMS